MLLEYNVIFILLFLSILLILFLGFLVGRMKNKKQIHYAFLSNIVFLFIWSFARLIQIFVQDNYKYAVLLEHLSYIGVIFVPISLLYTGIIFAKTRIEFSWKHLLLFIVPAISLFMVFTNNYHHLFIVKYSFMSTGFVYGSYY
ncbi:MAG: hypothetical protein K6T88_18585, partial [Bacillus sp. (in: Bacteria)]|nr:hypothetical protein [Bacillus sp. (in: firmicutes)]